MEHRRISITVINKFSHMIVPCTISILSTLSNIPQTCFNTYLSLLPWSSKWSLFSSSSFIHATCPVHFANTWNKCNNCDNKNLHHPSEPIQFEESKLMWSAPNITVRPIQCLQFACAHVYKHVCSVTCYTQTQPKKFW